MNFEKFQEKIREVLCSTVLVNAEIEVKKILKNNGVKYTGLLISEQDSNISPVIFLEEFYRLYKEGKTFSEVLNEIWEVYSDSKVEKKQNLDWFLDWSKVKGRVAFKLVNYEKNEQLLLKIPHRRFLDLAVVYQYILENDTEIERTATILIHNHHMTEWGVSEEELYACAYENYKLIMPVTIRSITEILAGVVGMDMTEGMVYDEVPMYIVGNKRMLNGAVAMLFLKELEEKSEIFNSDLYILPSSVHEIIVLPATKGEAGFLERIVKEVNQTQVCIEERLSDSVYYYSHEDGKVRIA